MKLQHKEVIIFLFIAFFSFADTVIGKSNYEFTPAIAISEVYDNNIELNQNSKKSDWITTVSPSINLVIKSEKSSLQFMYSPTIVKYKNVNEDLFIRHSGALTFSEKVAERVRFDLNDTFLRSDDPISQTLNIYDIRHNRNSYQQNSGSTSVNFFFASESAINLGYNNSILKNNDVTLYDNAYSNPFAGLTYWFNVNNGIELNYKYISVSFSRNDNHVPSDDYTGNITGIKYTHGFTLHTSAFLSYNFNSREFETSIKNYKIHDASIGVLHSFSDKSSLSMSGGYFQLMNKLLSDDKGYSYDVSLSKNFNRGSFTVSGSGGWRERYLESERQGLSRYWKMDLNLSYQVMEHFSNHAGLSYIEDRDEADKRRVKTYGGSYGWKISFLRWYSLSIDYSRFVGDNDILTGRYVDDRVMMTLSASKLFK
jgi:hypothetical protein